jgi:hypothetical protein
MRYKCVIRTLYCVEFVCVITLSTSSNMSRASIAFSSRIMRILDFVCLPNESNLKLPEGILNLAPVLNLLICVKVLIVKTIQSIHVQSKI